MKQSLKKKLDFVVRRPFPIITNTVFFQSFGGQYNDNPKYISEKLHDLRPEFHIVWAISPDKCNTKDIPEYVLRVDMNSNDYINYISKSQVLVDNMTGMRGSVRRKDSKGIKWLLSSKRQLNISTWHGTPIKRIGLDMKEAFSLSAYITSSDYLIAGCRYTQEHLSKAFAPINVICCGTPRNDILVKGLDDAQKRDLKIKLRLPVDKRIILFAPTFRDTSEYSGIFQMEKFDIGRILKTFQNKFGDEWVFVFRVHHEVLKKINAETISNKYAGMVISGNTHDDMAEYLAVSDALITDYSGSVFDYTLTGRPGFLFTPDKDHYLNDERGVYIPIEELPYPYAVDLEAFYQLIEDYQEEEALERINKFNIRVGNAEGGNASEFLARKIIKFIETGEKEV